MRALLLAAVTVGVLHAQPGESLVASPEYRARLELVAPMEELTTGRASGVVVRVENRGSAPWPSSATDPGHPVRLAYHWQDHRGQTVVFDGQRTELPQDLAPEAHATVRMVVLSPPSPGSYTLVIDLVREQVTWFGDRGSPTLRLSGLTVRGPWTVTRERLRILLLAGAILGLLWLIGRGVARWVGSTTSTTCPAPLLGASLVIAGGYYAAWFGVPMETAKWLLLALGVILVLIALVRTGWGRGVGADALIAGTFALVALALALLPLWRFGRPSTVLNTYSSYFVVMSEYWKLHALGSVPAADPYQPLSHLVWERLQHGYVDGTPFLNAFVAATLGVDSFETYSILTALLLALLPPSLYRVGRFACGLGVGPAVFVAFAGLFNVTYLLWSVRGQLPFVAGFVFLPVAVGSGAAALEGRGRVLVAALSLSSLLAVYPPLAPFAAVPLGIFATFLLATGAASWRDLSLRSGRLLALVAIVNPVILFFMGRSGLAMARQLGENWQNIPGYPSLAELLGFRAHFASDPQDAAARLVTHALLLLVFLVGAYGLVWAATGRRWLLLATVTPYTLGAVAIVVLLDYSYGFYKHGVVTLFAFLLALGAGLGALWRRKKGWRLLALTGGGGLVIAWLLAYQSIVGRDPEWVSPELASLRSVKQAISDLDVVFLDEGEVGRQLWASYFLRGVRLSIPPALEPWGWWGFSSVSGRGDSWRFYDPGATYTLTRWHDVVPGEPEPTFSTSLYRLDRGLPLVSLGTGWFPLEGGSPGFRWMGREATVRVHRERARDGAVRLRMTARPIAAPLTLEVTLGERPLGVLVASDTSGPWTFTTEPFLPDDMTPITIRSLDGCFQPSRLFGSTDTRCLSARFYDVRLEVVRAQR